MSWISKLESQGQITVALTHYNQAMTQIHTEQSFVEIARLLFNAMNKIQNEWVSTQTVFFDGDGKAFQTMIGEALSSMDSSCFISSEEVSKLVYFEPLIMDHKVLTKNQYNPNQELKPELVRKAGRLHHKLMNAFKTYNSERTDENTKRVIKRISELLYVVRSNIAHGEKTPYGPDLKKRERDEHVCKAVVPVQILLLDVLLDSPQKKLVVYGTLAPGNANNQVLSDLHGSWEYCKINGILSESGGYPFFEWNPSAPSIDAQLFISDDLPAHWDRLDHFEGPEYIRTLIPASKKDGICIANIYEINR